jgi:hypothetical protein
MELQTKNLHKLTLMCSLRCLLGCNIGEVSGVVIGSVLGLDMVTTIVIAIGLAFTTGYAFTMIPLLKKMSISQAAKVAVTGDTASIASMEFAENSIALLIPGFMAASLLDSMFWIGLGIMLPFGFLASYIVMYWVMKRGMTKCCHLDS